jgi:hypothetical protein
MPYLVSGALCITIGPHFSLIALLVLYFAIAGLGIFSAIQTLALDQAARFAAVFVYLGNPVIINELHAGHLLFFASYALMPWTIVLARGKNIPHRALLLGTCVGLGAAQQQFFAFGWLIAMLFLVKKSRLLDRVTVTLVALLVAMPQWIQAVISHVPALNIYAPFRHWEDAQSIAAPFFVRMLGYIGGYDFALPPVVTTCLWLLPAAGAVGLIFLRPADRLRVAILALVAALMMNGTNWPTGGMIDALFANVKAAGLFRELYNFVALWIVALTISIAALVDAVARRAWVAWCAAGVLAILSLCCNAYASEGITTVDGAGVDVAAVQTSYRFAVAPGFFPQAREGSIGGVAPSALGIGQSSLANATLPLQWPSAYLSALINAGDSTGMAAVSRRMAVGCVVTLKGVREVVQSTAEPALRSLPFVTPELLPVQPCGGNTSRLVIAPVGTSIDMQVPQTIPVLANYADSTDPNHGWVPLAWTPSLAPWIYEEPLGYFSLRSTEVFPAPVGTLLIGSNGALRVGGACRVAGALDEHWHAVRCSGPGEALIAGRPPLVISSRIKGSGTVSEAAPIKGARVEVMYSVPGAVLARVHAEAGALVVLRDYYDPLWEAALPASHVLADDYANGWLLRKSYDGVVLFLYIGSLARAVALVISSGFIIIAFLRLARVGRGKGSPA